MLHQVPVINTHTIMKKKVLITGASGFIGSFLVVEALRQNYQVYAGIRKSSSKKFLQYDNLNFFELDFSSQELLTQNFKIFQEQQGNFDFVIHNAGITQAKKLEDFTTVNYQYTKNLVDALSAASHTPEKFVLISSLASYGPGKTSMNPIQVSDEYKPISEYGKSKLKATEYVRSLSGFPHLVIHPTGVYGPRDKDFFQFIKLVSKGFEPYIGRHKQALSLIYVKDLARAVISLMSSSIVNSSYLLSDGQAYDKEEIGLEARRTLQKKTFRIKLPLKLVQMTVSGIDSVYRVLFNRLPFINRQKLDEISSANWLCNSDDIWKHINDKPDYNLQKGVAETIGWYKENNWL